jgi:uncharacterized protein (TIGR03382 family)
VLACNGQYLDVDDVDACRADLQKKGLEARGPIEALGEGSREILERSAVTCSVQSETKYGLAGLFMLLGLGLGAAGLRRRERVESN